MTTALTADQFARKIRDAEYRLARHIEMIADVRRHAAEGLRSLPDQEWFDWMNDITAKMRQNVADLEAQQAALA